MRTLRELRPMTGSSWRRDGSALRLASAWAAVVAGGGPPRGGGAPGAGRGGGRRSGGGAPLAAADARELGRDGAPPATTRWCSALGRGGVSVRLAAVSALVGCDGGRGDAGCGRRRRTRPWRLRSRLPG